VVWAVTGGCEAGKSVGRILFSFHLNAGDFYHDQYIAVPHQENILVASTMLPKFLDLVSRTQMKKQNPRNTQNT
jgi:hypothetical protein